MRDLKSFINQNKQNKVQTSTTKNDDFAGFPPESQRETIENVMSGLAGKSKPELMQALLSEVNKKKSEGTFSITEIESFAKNVAPMLDDNARRELYNVIDTLKSQ